VTVELLTAGELEEIEGSCEGACGKKPTHYVTLESSDGIANHFCDCFTCASRMMRMYDGHTSSQAIEEDRQMRLRGE